MLKQFDIEIPTWENGEWSVTAFPTRDDFK